jgi:asparagine synthase (glutamine-hydrolysing)
VWACQNGEIYNYPELRQQLLEERYPLRTRCDTEVLPALYQRYGKALPEQVQGMFALAVWDCRSRQGLLAPLLLRVAGKPVVCL